jgi:proteic killer suppression protein
VNPQWKNRLLVRLALLDQATSLDEIMETTWRPHLLTGDREGTWAINVTRNWRITFHFEDGNVYDVNLEDYHE